MTELGTWIGGYHELAPPADLADVVECGWSHTTPLDADRGEQHRVLPHFGASLCLERQRSADGRLDDGRVSFLGPVSEPSLFSVQPGRELIALRLRPEVCASLLAVDPATHWDAAEDYTLLAPDLAAGLQRPLVEDTSESASLGALCAWLRGRLAEAQRRPPPRLQAMHHVLEQLRRHDGRLRLTDLVRATGWSAPYLRRLFRDHLGHSAKRIACLFRLNAAVAVADGHGRPDWADIAYALGYTDQAHLGNDCRRMTGLSPMALHRERRAERRPL